MVPHVLQSAASSGVCHPVWMKGMVAFARSEFMMYVGVVLPGAWFPVAWLRLVWVDFSGEGGARSGFDASWGRVDRGTVPRCTLCRLYPRRLGVVYVYTFVPRRR